MRCISLLLVALVGCAPMYRPHLARSSMLDRPGDAQLAGGISPGGLQLGAAWSPEPGLGLRADLQADFSSGPYAMASLGVGRYWAGPSGLRVGLWLDGGAGWASATQSDNVSVLGSTIPDEHLSGSLTQLGGALELGYEGEKVASGMELRAVNQWVRHDADSDYSGVGTLASVEPLFLLRLGSRPVKLQGFIGLSLPVYRTGETGLQSPLVLGLGLVGDLRGVGVEL